MKDILIGVAVFAIIFGGALFGMLLGKILPDQHVGTESRDAIRIVMAMLATLSAVVLGLLTGSSISSLGEKEGELRSAGVQFIMLDRTLAEYGPETARNPGSAQAIACRKNKSDLAGGRRRGVAHGTQQRGRHRLGSAGSLCLVAADRTTAVAPVQCAADHRTP